MLDQNLQQQPYLVCQEDLLAQQGRIETNKQNANYNFDVYYDRVHSEVVSQAAERRDGDGDPRLDS